MNLGGSKSEKRLDALDGLRGYAALIVVPYHTITGIKPDSIPFLVGTPLIEMGASDPWMTKLAIAIFNGESAVLLFFVLSGYVLTRSVAQDLSRHPLLNVSIAFAIRRLFRIFPSLATCLIAIFIIVNTVHWLIPLSATSYSVKQLLANLLLLDFPLNGATWTLQAEMLAMPVMLAAGVLVGRWGLSGTAVLLLSALLVTRSALLNQGTYFLTVFQFYFIAGAVAFGIAGRVPEKARGLVPWWLVLAAFMAVSQLGLSPSVERYLRPALAGWLVGLIAVAPPRMLEHKVSVFFGRISYSFYLWNVLFMNLLLSFRDSFPLWLTQNQAVWGLVLALPIIALSIPPCQPHLYTRGAPRHCRRAQAFAAYSWRRCRKLGRRASHKRIALFRQAGGEIPGRKSACGAPRPKAPAGCS